jgi:hypothetical protein
MTNMRTITLLAIAIATATPVLAQPIDPAYRYSGQHAGGPADALISPTDGSPLPTWHAYSDPAYGYSGQHAGGPADNLISPMNGRLLPTWHAYSDPAYRYSGQHAGGPADALISNY